MPCGKALRGQVKEIYNIGESVSPCRLLASSLDGLKIGGCGSDEERGLFCPPTLKLKSGSRGAKVPPETETRSLGT